MKTAPRVLGTLSLLAALASLGFQLIVVLRLWAVFIETISLTNMLALGTAGAFLGLALAVAAIIVRRGVGLLAPLAGLMNLGLLAGYAYVFSVL